MGFADLKKKSQDLDSVREQVVQRGGGGDNGFIQLGIDQTGSGYIRVRLLPAPGEEVKPMVTYSRFNWKHGAKSYYALSLANVGRNKEDPCQRLLGTLWDEGTEAAKKIYTARKRKTTTVANAYVVEDKVNPENNGIVGRLRVPRHIEDLINTALDPKEDKFTGKKPESFNPFDIFGVAGGRDLIIRIKRKDDNNSYEDSHFVTTEEAGPWLGGDEAKMEQVWGTAKSLHYYVDPARHKEPVELLSLLIDVLGEDDEHIIKTFTQAEIDAALENGTKAKVDKPEGEGNKAAEEKASEARKPGANKASTETKADAPKTEEKKVEEKPATQTAKAPTEDGGDFDFDF